MGYRHLIGHWFKRKPTECTAEDVHFLYLLCLGRAPLDGDEISPLVGARFFATLKLLLGKQETRLSVLARLELGKQPPHASLSELELCDLAAGLQAHFGLEAFKEPLHWLDILIATANTSRFEKAFLSHFSHLRLDAFRQGLQGLKGKADVDIKGRITRVVGQEVVGQVINRLTPDTPLVLDFYLNGLYAGTTHADLPCDQFAGDFGGLTPWGFRHQFTVPDALKTCDRLTLSIFEKESGAPVIGAREVVISPTLGVEVMQRLSAELAGLRDHAHGSDAVLARLDQIEAQLPRLQQYASFPLSQYALFKETFPLAPPQWLARCDVRFDILVYDTGDADALQATLTSARRQSFPAQSVVIVGKEGTQNPAAAYTSAVPGLEGTHILMLEAGDKLAMHALAWIARSVEDHASAHVFYADYDHYEIGAHPHLEPCFQHAFDYDMLLQHNSFSRAFAIEREQLLSLGAFDENAGQCFHQYLLMRHYEMFGDKAFHHIPRMLWHLEKRPADPQRQRLLEEDQIRVCQSHLKRRGITATAVPMNDPYAGPVDDTLMLSWPVDKSLPKLGIIIPTKDRIELIKPCVESLLATLDHPDRTEIIIVDNGSDDQAVLQWFADVQENGTVTVVRSDTAFNWSHLNNIGAAATDASYLLFLNDDTLAMDKGWDTVLRGQLARNSVGAVGARLLYRNGTLQHGGMVLYGLDDVRHEGMGDPCNAPHPMHRTRRCHACVAVTGAFLACRRTDFNAVGGFDEAFAVTYNDVDFCFKMRQQGLRVLYEPQITFQHFQSESRGNDARDEAKRARALKEASLMAGRWQHQFHGDPFYPRAFARTGSPFTCLAPPILESANPS
ncbi:glycosyltransferase family 2 protein [Kordiimonas lacus]|uniref:Glycosyltransferase, GT2 family n=1 Tax=Kordiimonas lacus TaxID=637679 RepID=A0A1G7F7U8_9PROT|nr:glycosyltransferase family 2 protein [Kordiimonas lacus]SDE71635.1 Glycosyltransferase, GT2 family [Kordiimonas lacus]